MPTEEVYTTPDARLVEGTVRSTLPLQIQGNIVRGLEVRFAGGRAVEVRAETGEDVMRTHIATDDGATRLGEVALVDGRSAVGKTGLVFYDTLFDENASSHIALGAAIVQALPWAPELSPRGPARTGREPFVDPHRLHDRLERPGGRRHDQGGRSSPPAQQRRVATMNRGKPGFPRVDRDGRIRTDGFRLPKAAL